MNDVDLSRRQLVALELLADGPCHVSNRTDPGDRVVAHQTVRSFVDLDLAVRNDSTARLTDAGHALAADPPAPDPITHDHSTNACYQLDGCRCDPCERAHLDYDRGRRRDKLYGNPRTVDADPVREHVLQLMADRQRGSTNGVGLKRIAEVSGVSQGSLWRLIYGGPGRPGPSSTVRSDTAEALLAVTQADRAEGSTVAAGPTTERIRQLRDAGATWPELAEQTGLSQPGLWRIGNPDPAERLTVQVGTARAVHALWARWNAGGWHPRGRRSRWDNHDG